MSGCRESDVLLYELEDVSCLEQIDRWLGTFAKNTKVSRKALKGLFHLHTKTELQSAYILVLILVV